MLTGHSAFFYSKIEGLRTIVCSLTLHQVYRELYKMRNNEVNNVRALRS